MKKILPIILSLIILNACNKDDVIEPSIKTISIGYLASFYYTISGRINDLGTRSVSDYGFVYGGYWEVLNAPEYVSKVSLGRPTKIGLVKAMVNAPTDYLYNQRYYARMYIVTNEKGIIYGDTVSCFVPTIIY